MSATVRYWSTRHVVYRCYDAEGALLYIGATANLPTRLDTHRRESDWYFLLDRLRVQVFPGYQTALDAERRAIREEQPPFNIRSTAVGSPRGTKLDPRRIHPGGPEFIRAHMTVRGLTIRELADLCGGQKYRTAIGHLLSGARDTCNSALANQLQLVLLGRGHDVPLFESVRHLSAVSA